MSGAATEQNQPVRIAIFISCLRGGGAQRSMLNVAGGFAARGLSVDLLVARSTGAFAGPVPDGLRLVSLETPWSKLPWIRSRKWRWVLTSLPGLTRYLRRERPACLLSAMTHVNLVALLGRRLAGVPLTLVVSERSHLTRSAYNKHRAPRPIMPALVRRFYTWADGIIAVSSGVADDLAQVTEIPRERIEVVHNPVVGPELPINQKAPLDHPWFTEGQPPVVLGVGRFKRQKDFPTLLRAFARLRKTREVRLVILGEGKGERKMRSLARSLGIAEEVDLPGFDPNPSRYFSHAACFVLSSAWEGLPRVLIEALACGCPVVSTDCPSGPHEILEGGRYGSLVPVGDERAMANAIAQILDHPPDRNELRSRGAAFAVDSSTERYLAILRADTSSGISDARQPDYQDVHN
jgi:glycosyltransferase involved in cell wall biosynthesis